MLSVEIESLLIDLSVYFWYYQPLGCAMHHIEGETESLEER